MVDPSEFWLGLQRERTGLAWTRTLEAITAAQVIVAVDGLRTHRAGPTVIGILLLAFTISLVLWQYRTSARTHGNGVTDPARRLASTGLALVFLAAGGLLIVLT